jgi:hypothetical protein
VTAESRVVKAVLHGEYQTFPDVVRQLIAFAPLGFSSPENGQLLAAYRASHSNGGNIHAYVEGDNALLLEIYLTSKEAEPIADILGDARRLLADACRRKLNDGLAAIESAPSQAFQVLQSLSEVDVGVTNGVTQERWSVSQLMDYNPAQDPNAVVGIHDGLTTRYLCRGAGAWLIGQSGIGKSSLAIQQGFTWALGRPFFGITPVRPLRVLIVQNENDQGDCSEATQGVCAELCTTEEDMIAVEERARIVRCRGKTGGEFCHWLQAEVLEWKADLVYVDPLLRYAGIDVSRQDQCTRFLNEQLDPMLAHTGVVLIGAHHTGKPKSARETAGWTIYDHAYSGIGSSELVNWSRAISILRVISEQEGTFDLLLAKRGNRAWATHPNGELTTKLYLRHSTSGMCWQQVDPTDVPRETPQAKATSGGRPSKVQQIATMNLHSFCAQCKTEGETLRTISSRLEQWLAREHLDYSTSTCTRAVAALVANQKLQKTDGGLYVKGEQG